MSVTYTELPESHRRDEFMVLLLDADPSEEMIRRYLHKGRMFLAWKDGQTVGEAVVVPIDSASWEIKNLAVSPQYQGQGIGGGLLGHIAGALCGRCQTLLVGTSKGGMAFYEKCGFTYSHTIKGFFSDNYSPMYENGFLLEDMYYLCLSVGNE